MAGAVDIGVEGETGLLGGGDELMGEGQNGPVVLDLQGTATPSVGIVAGGHVFGFSEIGQHVLVAPPVAAQLRPSIVVGGVAADIKHAIDGAGTAQRAASWPMDRPAVGAGLGFGGVVPIQGRMIQQMADPGRNVNHWVTVGRSGLQQGDAGAPLDQTGGHGTATGTGADHDVIARAGHGRARRQRRSCVG